MSPLSVMIFITTGLAGLTLSTLAIECSHVPIVEKLGQVPDVGCPVEFVAELKFLGIVGCLSSGVVGHLLL